MVPSRLEADNRIPKGNHQVLFHHPQHHSTHLLQPVTRLRRQSLKLGRSGIRIDHMEHGFPSFLVPSPFDCLPFFLPNLKLLIEALNGHERVLYGGLHGNSELALLLAKLEGHPFQDLRELPQDFQRNVPVGS